MSNISKLYSSLLLGTLCSISAFAEEEITLTVDQEVATAIKALEDSSPKKQLVSTIFTFALPSSPDKIVPTEAIHEYLGGNMWGNRSVALINGNNMRTTAISLCGLVDLIVGSETNITTQTSAMTLIGPIFVPLGMKISHTHSSSYKTSKLLLAANASKMCNPTPGEFFTYEVVSDLTFGNRSTVSSPRKIQSTISWTCAVGAPTKSEGSSLPAGISYFPVECKGTNQASGKDLRALYAYLPESALYTKIGSVGDATKPLYEYTKIEQAAR